MGSLAQNSPGAIRCSCNTRFRTRCLPVQMADEVLEDSGEIANEVPEGSGADC